MYAAQLLINGKDQGGLSPLSLTDDEDSALNGLTWINPHGDKLNMWETEYFCKLQGWKFEIQLYECFPLNKRIIVSMEAR